MSRRLPERTYACEACIRHSWLLGRVSGLLQYERGRIEEALALDDDALLEWWSAKKAQDGIAGEYAEFGPRRAQAERARAASGGLECVCMHDPHYPPALHDLRSPPATLHVAGGMDRFLALVEADPVAIVGTRAPTEYGEQMALGLGRGVAASGITVVSGLARGIDSAAHRGALAGGGGTIAVLPGCAADPYPKQNARLYRRMLEAGGVAVSELGPGVSVRAWTFLARNRIIAALSRLTVVVQGPLKSGSLVTARMAQDAGRAVGAVPGSALVAQSKGPHALLEGGATLIASPQNVLDAVFGAGVRQSVGAGTHGADGSGGLTPQQRAVLDAIERGQDTPARLTAGGFAAGELLVALSELEMGGHIQRGRGGRYMRAV